MAALLTAAAVAFQRIYHSFVYLYNRRIILSFCRANNLERLIERLFQHPEPGDENIITEEILLACLKDGRRWRLHDGKLTRSALDCASVVLVYSLWKISSSDLPLPQDIAEPSRTLSTLLGRAFGGSIDLDSCLLPDNCYFENSRQPHMLVLMSAALLGYKGIIESCHRQIICEPMFFITDWIMLATVAGHDEMLRRIVPTEPPSYYSDATVVLFPYLLTLAEELGRDLSGTLNVFTQHYLNPCRGQTQGVPLCIYLDCLVKFDSSCAVDGTTGVLARKPERLVEHAEFLLDVDSSHRLLIHPATVCTSSYLQYFLPHLYTTTQSPPARSLCFRIFQKLCDRGAGGRFLLDVDYWWNRIDAGSLRSLVYFLVESVHAASHTFPARDFDACELCANPITSFLLYVVEKKGRDQAMQDRLKAAGLADRLRELAGYMEVEGLLLLQRGKARRCSEHCKQFPGDFAQLSGTLLRTRGVPSLKVIAMTTLLHSFGPPDNPHHYVLRKLSHLNYIKDLEEQQNS